jgi:Domain of unknown function (DUF397)
MTASTQLPLAGPHWRKSSYSNWSNQCVEVAQAGGTIAVRDSKNPGAGYLTFTTAEWEAFLTQIKHHRPGK